MLPNTHQPAKNELLQAIAYYVKRQELVEQAILDFNLDLDDMGKWGALAWTLNAEKAEKIRDTAPKEIQGMIDRIIERKYEGMPQEGTWKDTNEQEWRYFLHGGGCRLTNKVTQEPIDWDPPNTAHFDPWKFRFHLDWQIETNSEKYPNLKRFMQENPTNDVIKNLFDELAAEKLLNSNHSLG